MVLVDDQVLPVFAFLPNDVELREDVRPAEHGAAGEAVTVEALVVAIRVRHL